MKQFRLSLSSAVGVLLAAAAVGLLFSAASCSERSDETGDASRVTPAGVKADGYIGAKACAECHQQEHDDWVGSHHDAAMKPATPDTVIGDFDDATFTHFGTTSRFFTRDGKYYVNTDGPDGKPADFEIKYTFGIEPLQQYLVEFPGGKVQALTICWDARPKEAGGQRWYHLYPDEPVPHDDALHWTGPNFTWNHMCAECHSTDLQKNYDATTDTYQTTWAEINVSCEACHGPGEAHAEWAELYTLDQTIDKGDMGLVVRLKDESRQWVMNTETGIAERLTPMGEDKVLNACARCHSRRSQISDNRDAGVAFLDNY
ncbi:MAG: multiheme c-type cytochrome, partial [Phycisphaeraceae bacterium]